MDYKGIFRMLGNLLFLEACFFIPSIAISLFDKEQNVFKAFLLTAAILVVISIFLRICTRNAKGTFHAREGFLLVALSWIIMSVFGALPFFISGAIPNYIDALFETVSGFTTTGASLLTDVEGIGRGLLFWRSFTNWLGGMGILVFMLAIVPAAKGSGENVHVLRAESPGPAVEKITPKTRNHAAILYSIYVGMTLLCFVFLICGDMPLFDSVCTSFATAGTGGYSVLSDSLASYSSYSQIVVAIFMLLFGINFNFFYLLILRRFKEALFDEEVRTYIFIFISATILIVINTLKVFGSFSETLKNVSFTVSSIMTSTGFSTVDYDIWPEFSRGLLLVLMMIGACAGSTGGGIKISRVLILFKSGYRELRKLLHPRSVMLVRLNKHVVDEDTIRGVNIFTTTYVFVFIFSFLLISLDNFSLETNMSAVISCLSNIGPGLGLVGPTSNYAGFSIFSKIVLSIDMLLGRLEIFPLLILFHHRTWSKAD